MDAVHRQGSSSSFSGVVRGPSGRLVAAAFAGAAWPVVQPNDASVEATPLSRRASMQHQMQERSGEVFDELIRRFMAVMACVCLIFFLALLAFFCIFLRAAYAAAVHSDKACDQPLKFYVLATVSWGFCGGQLNQLAIKCMQNRVHNTMTKLFIGILLAVPGWLIVAWGLHMVLSCKTCPDTNPGLYYPTKHYIFTQVAYLPILLVIIVVSALHLRWLMPLLARLRQTPGCQAAVRRLPRVATDDPELLDPEDGSPIDCPICMESLADPQQVVVRCPCEHPFHEECLAKWCQSHIDCPLCRAQVGEPDEPTGDEAA